MLPASDDEPGAVSYALDADDRLLAVNAAWQAFAVENGGAPASAVIGTPLWQHVSDDAVRHLYARLFHRVRATQRPFRVPFRCDAPDAVREMTLDILPRPGGGLVLRSRIVREVERAPLLLLARHLPRSDDFLRMCGWCMRVDLEGTWHQVEDAVTSARLLCEVPAPQVTHGICADCERVVFAALHAEELRDGAHP
ncbi:MAG: hypothetical protein ACXWZS_04095 [Gemmatirosa sp.]